MGMDKKLAAEWGLMIDPTIRDFMPRDPERVKQLEALIIEEGCTDPLIVWRETRIVADGNTRYEICERNNIPFAVEYRDFESKADLMQWALDRQWARRNMSIPEKIIAVHKIEDEIRAEAKGRQGMRTDLNNIVQNSTQCSKGKSRDKLGDMAGVSGWTYERGKDIIENAPEPIREAWEREEITTNAAYNFMQLDTEQKEEALEQIKSGEPVKKTVRNTMKDKRGNQTGWTLEDRKNRAETVDISSDMRNIDVVPDYDIDMLIEEIRINGKNFVDMMGGILRDHENIVTDDCKATVANAIDEYILNDLTDMRRSIA